MKSSELFKLLAKDGWFEISLLNALLKQADIKSNKR